MVQPDELDTLLEELYQQTGNLLTMIDIVRQLRRSQRQLLPALRTMMVELCELIGEMVPELPEEHTNV